MLVTLIFALMATGYAWQAASAQEAESSELSSDEVSRAKAWFDKFDKNAPTLVIKPKSADEKYAVVLPPLLRFSTEGKTFGTVYVWEDAEELPAVIGTLGSLPFYNVQTMFTEFHLLKPEAIEPMTFVGIPGKTWDPNVETLAFKDFPTATPVAPTEARRLVQMRSLARQFTAEMDHRDQKYNLRLLAQPIYRFKKSTQERDGALFAFVWDNGTDPELIVYIEAEKQNDGVSWRYQPIRSTYRELRLMHEGELVWEGKEFMERDQSVQTFPYITGLMWLPEW